MPYEIGVQWNDLAIPSRFPTMGDIFRNAGYYTIWSGKWHVPKSYPDPKKGEFIRGFDYLQLPDGIQHLGIGDRVDGIATDMACNWLTQVAPRLDQPWVMGLSLHNPHDICGWTWRKPVKSQRQNDYPPLPDNHLSRHDDIDFLRICRERNHYGNENQSAMKWEPDQWRAYLHEYARLTGQVDNLIGNVLDALDRGGWTDNTVVIFTSDHGEGMAEHYWVVKLFFWESIVSVPMIIRYPGSIPAGVVNASHLVSGLDILPTMCDYAGIEPLDEFRGVSMRQTIENPRTTGRDYIVTELAPDPKDQDLQGRMVCSLRYKYCVFNRGENREMLFDLDVDPGETNNRAKDGSMRAILDAHRGYLREFQNQTCDTFA
jgi:arylsulfatase A-like enzyme